MNKHIAIIFAAVTYIVALLKLGALTPDEILAFPKGNQILGLLKKVKLIKTEQPV